ncbi:1,4-alpha-glucan branching enzyme [Lewinella marina]|uniref:1,4-alpha-glucan branching enzyme n=1 Tax=Neolewinella marina TaxID=438751 RepID=A0A2G0CIF1_9BACT|nr:alpha-amylase family glycosyl hydrolase [Neolewinella marina]NJB85097.1 1,4-alpha-glucan branching enzyme [Neolewinella marina]PHK99764.1 1,4-alpha-glucan branching protein [Neolewinella marina]
MITTMQAPLGATLTDQAVHFSVWAPNAKSVAVTGDFNKWDEEGFPLFPAEDGSGNWSATVPKAGAGSEYQFVIVGADGERRQRIDPRARRVTNSVGNAIVYADDFDWEDDDFTMPAWNELVIYELHVGTFNVKKKGEPGTFDSVIERLDYLVDLGVNCIHVMPVCEFAGDFSWGYNPAHPFAVEEAYGGPDGLKRLVRAAHREGIAVVLDVVYNHFGPSDLSLWQFDGWYENDKGGIYFYNDWRSSTPWGDTRPDYGREEVRQYIHDNAMMWLEEFRCDGLRMDMIPYMRHVSGGESDDDRLEEGYSLLRWINSSIAEKYPHKITVAEDLHGNAFVTDPPEMGGCGFGTQWDGDFVHPVREAIITPEDSHRSIPSLVNALLRRYSLDAFNRTVYTESHDEVANGSARVVEEIAAETGAVDNYYSFKRAALGAAMTMTSPGIPMLFQGQALLEDKWFSDQDPLDWTRLERFSGVRNLFRDLVRKRRNLEGNTRGLQGQHTQVIAANDNDKILAYLRWYDDPASDGVLVVLNFSNDSFDGYALGLDFSARWQLVFNSDWKGYSEHNVDVPTYPLVETEAVEQDGRPHRVLVNTGPYGAHIFALAPQE